MFLANVKFTRRFRLVPPEQGLCIPWKFLAFPRVCWFYFRLTTWTAWTTVCARARCWRAWGRRARGCTGSCGLTCCCCSCGLTSGSGSCSGWLVRSRCSCSGWLIRSPWPFNHHKWWCQKPHCYCDKHLHSMTLKKLPIRIKAWKYTRLVAKPSAVHAVLPLFKTANCCLCKCRTWVLSFFFAAQKKRHSESLFLGKDLLVIPG